MQNSSRQLYLILLGTSLLLGSLLLSACDQVLDNDDDVIIPTRVDVDSQSLLTAEYYTQQAPTPGFETVSFPEIDDNLLTTVYSRAEIHATFSGFFSESRESIEDARMTVKIWNDEFNVRRHVLLEFEGTVFSGDSTNLDIVRFGSNQYYMMDPDGSCITDSEQIAEIATIRAGQLIGGVEFAQPTARINTINGYLAWEYGFDPQFINPPLLQFTDDTSALDYLTGTIWVAPAENVVVRYIIEMNVNRAILFFGDRPVTGRLRYQYDVFDLGERPNISIPNGC